MQISGFFYDGLSSRQHETSAIVSDACLIIQGNRIHQEYSLQDVKISDRIGKTARYLQFPDGCKFETYDNDAIDSIFSDHLKNNRSHLLHLLESKKRFIISSIVILVLLSGWTGIYGIPWFAKTAAHAMPSDINQTLGREVVSIMDRAFFTSSELDAKQKEKVIKLFSRLVKVDPENNYTLLFRRSEKIGANAFALPSGEIIITDQLVLAAEDEQEILSVLAHEIGHVKNRHGLQSVIQDSVLTLFVMAVTGDIASATTFAASIPLFLTQSHYSREFEREADEFAFEYLTTNNIDTGYYARILQRITPKSDKSELVNYLSSHPNTDERIKKFKNHSQLD